MARIGSVAAAPFVGDQFVSLYIGATRVPTVPGKPADIGYAEGYEDPDRAEIQFLTPANDGGSPVTGYLFYLDGSATHTVPDSLVEPEPGVYLATFNGETRCGEQVSVRAVNAIGAGPPNVAQVDCP